MARIKKGWSQKDKARSLEDIGSAISFNIWQISGQGVLDLENEGFQTDTASQRLDVITEYVAYLVQIVDRSLFEGFDLDHRKGLITATGLHLASIMQDNRQDTDGTGDYTTDFLKVMNSRIGEYSNCQLDEKEGPSFVFLRLLGDHVTAQMGEKDAKWITSYVIDIVGKKMYDDITRVLPGLLDPAKREIPAIDRLRGKNLDQ